MSLDSKNNRMKEFNKFLLALKLLKQQQQKKKHNSKRSELQKISMSFTKSIIMPIKTIMKVKMS